MTYRSLRYDGARFEWMLYGGCYRVRLWPWFRRSRQDGNGWRSHEWGWLGWVFTYRWWPRV